MEHELDPKKRILLAAEDLLRQGLSADSITMRQIALQANVGIGLINYHFQTKDNLLNEAFGSIMIEKANSWLTPQNTDIDPRQRLKHLIKQFAQMAIEQPALINIGVSHALYHSHFEVPAMILPLLREIYKDTKDELSLRMIAMALITSLQVALLRLDGFQAFLGFDFNDARQREPIIDKYIDQIIGA